MYADSLSAYRAMKCMDALEKSPRPIRSYVIPFRFASLLVIVEGVNVRGKSQGGKSLYLEGK